MVKKVIIVLCVVLSVFTFSFSCFAEGLASNTVTSPYGQNGAGLGLNGIGNVQIVRGGLLNSSFSYGYDLQMVDYIDYKQQFYGGFDGYFDTSYLDRYVLYRINATQALPAEYHRLLLPPTYLGLKEVNPQVHLQYAVQYGNSYGHTDLPTSYFQPGNTYRLLFNLYFTDVSDLTDLNFDITPSYTFMNFTKCDVYSDGRYSGSPTLYSAQASSNGKKISIDMHDENGFPNYLTFRVDFTVSSAPNFAYVEDNSFTNTYRYFYQVFDIKFSTFRYTNDEKSQIQKAGENAVESGNNSVNSTTADSANEGLSGLVSALSYNGEVAKLNIPAFTWGLGNIIPERTWFNGAEVDFGQAIISYVPREVMTLIRALGDIAVVFFCVKELYNLISTVLVNRKASDDNE